MRTSTAFLLACALLPACSDDAPDPPEVSESESGTTDGSDPQATPDDDDGETDPPDDDEDGTETETGPTADTEPGTETSDTDVGPSVPVDDSMSFFVTSEGNGAAGGNYGGLAGADARCQALADAAGGPAKTWRAYLSAQALPGGGGEEINARDRIGAGPWFNAAGEMVGADVDGLHAAGIAPSLMFTEQGTTVPGDEHDILTGSDADGRALAFFPDNPDSPPPTCFNWTAGDANSWVWVGHADAEGPDTWNSAHGTSCDEAGLEATAGSGRLYCFAAE